MNTTIKPYQTMIDVLLHPEDKWETPEQMQSYVLNVLKGTQGRYAKSWALTYGWEYMFEVIQSQGVLQVNEVEQAWVSSDHP